MYQVASLKFTIFFEERNYRLVVMREESDDPQPSLFTGKFIYLCILINDHESSEKEVIEFYNQRGASENNFDVMNNDFGWNHLPYSDINYNTVYLIITAMLKNFYLYILANISRYFSDILPTTRIKRFIFAGLPKPTMETQSLHRPSIRKTLRLMVNLKRPLKCEEGKIVVVWIMILFR